MQPRSVPIPLLWEPDMPIDPTFAQLAAGFDAARAVADSSPWGHMISDDEVRTVVAEVLQAALNATPAPKPAKRKNP
jgi:hypothetical protein